MARKANPTSTNILALIKGARIDLARAALVVCEGDDSGFSRQTGHRSFNFRTRHHDLEL